MQRRRNEAHSKLAALCDPNPRRGGQDLSDRIQRAIKARAVFIRVCSRGVASQVKVRRERNQE